MPIQLNSLKHKKKKIQTYLSRANTISQHCTTVGLTHLFRQNSPVPADLGGGAEVQGGQEGHDVKWQEAGQHRCEIRLSCWKGFGQQISTVPARVIDILYFSGRCCDISDCQKGWKKGRHLSWALVHRLSTECSMCFLCWSVHRSNQCSTRLILSSNNCKGTNISAGPTIAHLMRLKYQPADWEKQICL